MAPHPYSIVVWVKELSIIGSDWEGNFAWSCLRTGTIIINGGWWQGFKIDYEGCWNDVASSNVFWLTESIINGQLIFPLFCFPVIVSRIHSETEPPSKPRQFEEAKTRQPVNVRDSIESRNQKVLSFNLFLLIIGRLLFVSSLWCVCLSILAMPSPNYSCFHFSLFEIYYHKESGLEALGIEA